jgi:hypothetical protein
MDLSACPNNFLNTIEAIIPILKIFTYCVLMKIFVLLSLMGIFLPVVSVSALNKKRYYFVVQKKIAKKKGKNKNKNC